MRMIMLFLILINLIGCNNSAGHRGVSGNIDESKNRGVFVQEYMSSSTPYKINDTLQVTVKEAWIERQWAHSQDPNQTISVDGYQLCIKSVEADLQGIDFKWTIGINGDKYIRRSGKSALISDFVELPSGDTVVYQVQKGSNLSDESSKEIVGKFELVKK